MMVMARRATGYGADGDDDGDDDGGGRRQQRVIGHGILAGKYLAEYRDSLK